MTYLVLVLVAAAFIFCASFGGVTLVCRAIENAITGHEPAHQPDR